jgi:hypothetical protein
MRKLEIASTGAAAIAVAALSSTPAMAGIPVTPNLPAPGIIGLVAAGVIAAVAVARWRK